MADSALRRLVAAAVSAAVGEAMRRIVVPTAVDGTVDDIVGATADVDTGDGAVVPCTIAYANPAIGDRVVVVFYGRGVAYCHGPIPGPAA